MQSSNEFLPPPPTSSRYEKVAHFFFRYVGCLFMEPNPDGVYVASLARIATFALLMQAMSHWHHDRELLISQKDILYVLLSYLLGSKVVGAIHAGITANAATKQVLAQNTISITAAQPTIERAKEMGRNANL